MVDKKPYLNAALDKFKAWGAKFYVSEAEIPDPARVDLTRQESGLTRPVTKELASLDKDSVREDRRTKLEDISKMIGSDPRVRRMFRKMKTDSCVGGFDIQVTEGPTESQSAEAQMIVDSFVKRTKLKKSVKSWVPNLLRHGDLFVQIEVDDKSREVTRLKRLASEITYSNMDAEGNFPEDKPAYYQEHPWHRHLQIKEFEAWQVCHIKWEGSPDTPYGEPLFSSVRLAWNRLDSGEKNVSLGRALRSGDQKLHTIGTADMPTDEDDIELYRQRNKRALENHTDPVKHFFSNGLVDIKDLGSDEQVGEVTDVQYFEGLLAIASGVPYALLGGGREESINRDVLDEQEEDYYRTLSEINDEFSEALMEIIGFQFALLGKNIDAFTIAINWGAKDRDDIDSKIARAGKLLEMGFSFETAFAVADLNDLSFDEEMERIKRQIADGVVPYGINIKAQTDLLAALGTIAAPKVEAIDPLVHDGNGSYPMEV